MELQLVQSLNHVQLFSTPWTAACQASLSITNSWSLLKLMSIKFVMPSNHLIFYCFLLFLPSILPRFRVFSNDSVLHIRWPKYWSFSFNISPSNEYSGLIAFRIDWFHLLAVQESSSAPQFESINSLALSLLYGPTLTFEMTTEKTIAKKFILIEHPQIKYSKLATWWFWDPGYFHSDTQLFCGINLKQSPTILGEGNGSPLQCSCLKNPMDRGAW